MAGRAATATAVKAKPTTPKVRSGAKASARVKAAKPAPVTTEIVDGVEQAVPKTRRRVKVETRTRIYWAVFNPDLKRVAVFEFDQKVEAEKRATKLSESGAPHFIQKIKATVTVK